MPVFGKSYVSIFPCVNNSILNNYLPVITTASNTVPSFTNYCPLHDKVYTNETSKCPYCIEEKTKREIGKIYPVELYKYLLGAQVCAGEVKPPILLTENETFSACADEYGLARAQELFGLKKKETKDNIYSNYIYSGPFWK